MGGRKFRKTGPRRPQTLVPLMPLPGTVSSLPSNQPTPAEAAVESVEEPINDGRQAEEATILEPTPEDPVVPLTPEPPMIPTIDLTEIKDLMRDIRLDMGSMKRELQAVKAEVSSLLTGVVQPSIAETKNIAQSASELAWQESASRTLMIVGIPGHINKTSEPTLHQVFVKMCFLLGYPAKAMPFCRMHRRYLTHDPIPEDKVVKVPEQVQSLLVLEFAFKQERTEFYAAYLDKSKKIRLKGLDLAVGRADARVYVNEYLSRANAQIKKRALAMKVAKKLRQVFTRNGIVHVVTSERSLPQRIDELETLNKLERQIDSEAPPATQSPQKKPPQSPRKKPVKNPQKKQSKKAVKEQNVQ